MRKTKGISLIVLAITIIVMIILAGTVIITLMDQDIIERAETTVKDLDIAEVQSLAELKWSDAYIAGKRTKEELTQAVIDGLKEELGEEVVAQYVIGVNDEGVSISKYGSPWIVSTEDTVPIPKGFVASSVEGENRKNSGLVIYEGTEPVTDANHYEALRTRNQYVWVPVEDFSKFVRQDFDYSSYKISNTLGKDYWEVVLDTATNMPLAEQNMTYISETTLAEVQAMYESIKEYKGFYIGRYEASSDSKKIYIVMGQKPEIIKNDNVEQVARSIYPKTNVNYGVVSTLTYGVQWDSTLQWWLDTNAVTSLNDSKSYGNYETSVIDSTDLNEGAIYAAGLHTRDELCGDESLCIPVNNKLGTFVEATSSSLKPWGTIWKLSTGALKFARVNNIWDMAGNIEECTMEYAMMAGEPYHVARGGDYTFGHLNRVINRESMYINNNAGFRPCLYIKN